jgi:hypothetical protein
MIVTEDALARWIYEYYEHCRQERENLYENTWRLSYDAFRGVYSSENLARWKALEGHEWRSKVFVRLTKQKIVAAVSQIEDIEFQGGKLPFSLEPTPIPEDHLGLILPPEVAGMRCNGMKKRIEDNLTESNAQRQFMGGLLEQALYGFSWLKSPVVRQYNRQRVNLVVPGANEFSYLPPELVIQYGRHMIQDYIKLIPTCEHVNIWDVFFDPEVLDHQDGQGLIHRVMMSPARFYGLLDTPGYVGEAIQEIFDQCKNTDSPTAGGSTSEDGSHGPYREKLLKKKREITALEFFGRVPRRLLENRDNVNLEEAPDGRDVEVICTVAVTGKQPRIIREPTVNMYPGKTRPLHIARWEDVPFEVGGVGVPENMQDSQAMVNSAVRCFVDNKALSSNLLIFGKSNALKPGQSKDMHSGKFFELANHVMDVRQAMTFEAVPDVTAGLTEMITMFERFADQESQLPALLQGENPKFNPKTAFAFGQLMESANKSMGKVIRNREHGHYIPVITGLYHYEMITNPNENLKGDYTTKATGYSTYLNKIQRGQMLQNLLTMVLSNQLLMAMVDPRKHLEEIYRSSDLDPDVYLIPQGQVEARAAMMLQSMMAPPGMEQGAPQAGGMPV